MQIQDLDNLDVDKYPDLKELQAFYTVMKAGDALYIPGTTQIHMLDVHTYAHAYGDMLQHTNVFLIFHVASHDSSSSLSLSLSLSLSSCHSWRIHLLLPHPTCLCLPYEQGRGSTTWKPSSSTEV
mmetsp:Transcript_20416/g.52367  ORF Transcript_20416/g.52367 Transcript_20416/m.52367 type:complete len:125 (+) Transcript_20416:88-462(+)